MPTKKSFNRRLGLFLTFIYFFSGFAALVYQVVWQRWLAFFTGISSVNISLIVSAFMAGLGIGYLVGGYLADKLKEGQHPIAFLIAELGIGGFAIVSKFVFYDWLYLQNQTIDLPVLTTYLLLFAVLLVPTFFMGVSLPLLSKSFNSLKNQGNFISLLYFTNTLGSAIGTFATAFYLIPNFGFETSVFIAAGLNIFCGISVFIAFKLFRQEKIGSVTPEKVAEDSDAKIPFMFWLTQYFISGFAALSLEIVWFRMIDVMMKSYAVTFSLILTIYLGSMAIGTIFGVYFNNWYKGPKLRIFLIVQYCLYAYVAISVFLLHFSVTNFGFLEPLRLFFEIYEMEQSLSSKIITMFVIPVALMSFPTFAMGFSFSISQNIIQRDFSIVGRKVGALQFINILGSTLGAWFATLVGFEILGSSLTIKLLSLLGILYLLILWRRHLLKPIQALVLGTVIVFFLFVIPNRKEFWMNLSGVRVSENFIFSEDKTALSSIKKSGAVYNVFINGLGQSFFPMHEDYYHIMLGAIPAFVHESPKDIGIIGLGSSGTLYGASGRAESERIDCWEVIKSQPQVLMEYVERSGDSSAYHILTDKRVNLVLDDGRKALQTSNKLYDVLEADALRPKSSYSGNVYSVEYFRLLKSRLKPKGIAVTWAPTERIQNGFRAVFPYVYQIAGSMYIGSKEPLNFDKNRILERFDDEFTKQFYAKAKINAKSHMEHFLEGLVVIQSGNITEGTDKNSDMWPKDEYDRK